MESKFKIRDRVKAKSGVKIAYCKPDECGTVVDNNTCCGDYVIVKWDNSYLEAMESCWSKEYPPCASSVSGSDLELIPATMKAYELMKLASEDPKSVSFMEAANSGKEIKHRAWSKFYSLEKALLLLSESHHALNWLSGEWLIREG
jgi:hypothetical protein